MTVFSALADPTRVRILDLLCERERSVGELVDEFQLTQPAVSQHLRVLREAGLVAATAAAQRRVYRITPQPLRELDGWLQRYRAFWATELDSLERHLDDNPDCEDGSP
jgi:DNA-binding transcriptional ArsR family regulator